MSTKPQDIVVALRLCRGGSPVYAELGKDLGMSASEVHASVRRVQNVRLVEVANRHVRQGALKLFLVHGVPFAFPAALGSVTRGIPTAWAAPVTEGRFDGKGQLQPVWPDAEGVVQGLAVKPLYSSVPHAVRADKYLYDLLALVDCLRIGRARERQWAEQEISRRLATHE